MCGLVRAVTKSELSRLLIHEKNKVLCILLVCTAGYFEG